MDSKKARRTASCLLFFTFLTSNFFSTASEKRSLAVSTSGITKRVTKETVSSLDNMHGLSRASLFVSIFGMLLFLHESSTVTTQHALSKAISYYSQRAIDNLLNQTHTSQRQMLTNLCTESDPEFLDPQPFHKRPKHASLSSHFFPISVTLSVKNHNPQSSEKPILVAAQKQNLFRKDNHSQSLNQ